MPTNLENRDPDRDIWGQKITQGWKEKFVQAFTLVNHAGAIPSDTDPLVVSIAPSSSLPSGNNTIGNTYTNTKPIRDDSWVIAKWYGSQTTLGEFSVANRMFWYSLTNNSNSFRSVKFFGKNGVVVPWTDNAEYEIGLWPYATFVHPVSPTHIRMSNGEMIKILVTSERGRNNNSTTGLATDDVTAVFYI